MVALTITDLENAKKHDTFHSEVITGKVGGLASGDNIDFSTNAVTGQVQTTLPKIFEGAGYSVDGDFATLPTITAPNQVLTSKSVVGYEGFVWRYTGGALPYTPSGSDPTQAPELGKWVAVAIGELQTIARSLNVNDSDIIYDTDTVTPIPSYIYSSSQQKTYSVPAGAQGKIISSVVGSTLNTTVGGPYTLVAMVTNNNEFDSVAEMCAASFEIGDTATTKGRVSAGDGGAAKYICVADGTNTNGVEGHHDGYDYFQLSGVQLSLTHSGVVFPEQFGWVGDWDGATGTDNTLAINNMISYCSPYEFDTDIPTTLSDIGRVRAKIIGGSGTAKITDSILINPFLRWEGLKKGGFFNKNGGTQIAADFTDLSKYVADTAPMFTGGARPLGGTYSRADFDNGLTPGCPGWVIDGVTFYASSGNRLKGAFNRQISQQSLLINCALGISGAGECFEGVKSSVCWGGRMSDNHIVATAYSIRNENDVTTDYQHNNYLTRTGLKPPPLDYNYVTWPNIDLQDKSACVVNLFADPHMDSNTHEGAEIGIQHTGGGFAMREVNGYFEAIGELVYAVHSVQSEMKPKWVDAENAELISIRGGGTTSARIDLSSASSFTLDGFGFIEPSVKGIYITGSEAVTQFPYTSRVVLEDLPFNGVLNIHVNTSGGDLNSGYSSSNPVLTIQEAVSRCIPGVLNRINVASGQTISTKYAFLSGNVTSTKIENLNIEIIGSSSTISVGESFGETHCLPLSCCKAKLIGVDINLSSAASLGDYRSFLRSSGQVDYHLESCSISGANGSLFGSQFNTEGSAKITMRGVTLGLNVAFTDNSSQTKSFSWIETSRSITNNGAVVGTGSDGKIFSTVF
jgi:hypothetical protein